MEQAASISSMNPGYERRAAALESLALLSRTLASDFRSSAADELPGKITRSEPDAAKNHELDPRALWTGDDDAAQAEALQTLQMLGQKSGKPQQSEDSLAQLQKELELEVIQREAVEARLYEERGKADAAQKQILCLEYELDSKEAQVANLQSTLDIRDSELLQAKKHIRSLQVQLIDLQGVQLDTDSLYLRRLRAQISDRETKHAEKDLQIKHILAVIGQNRNDALADDDAMTTYGSEISLSGYTASSRSTYR